MRTLRTGPFELFTDEDLTFLLRVCPTITSVSSPELRSFTAKPRTMEKACILMEKLSMLKLKSVAFHLPPNSPEDLTKLFDIFSKTHMGITDITIDPDVSARQGPISSRLTLQTLSPLLKLADLEVVSIRTDPVISFRNPDIHCLADSWERLRKLSLRRHRAVPSARRAVDSVPSFSAGQGPFHATESWDSPYPIVSTGDSPFPPSMPSPVLAP